MTTAPILGLAGKLAEARAWMARTAATDEALRVYISLRWSMLDPENAEWLFHKIKAQS